MFSPTLTAAQKKKSGKQKTPSSAEARQAIASANKQIKDAENGLQAMAKKADAAGTAAARRSLVSSGLADAEAALKRAQAEFAGVNSTLVRVIRERSDWLAASEEAKTAGEALRALSTSEQDAAAKKARRAELSAIVRRPREIEERELAANADHRLALDKLNQAVAVERKARTRYARDLSQDAKFKAAKEELESARDKVTKGRRDLSAAQRDLAAAQRAEAQAKRADQAKKQQQQKKKNNMQGKGKKKGKGKK